MPKKTHAQFQAAACAAGAKKVFRYWTDKPRRLVTHAKFFIRDDPQMIFHVLYCDGQADVQVERSQNWWGLVDFKNIEEDFELAFKVREFAKEMNS